MKVYAVILAAGRGKRMKSCRPKVLHEVLGKPIIQHTIETVKELNPRKLVVVVGDRSEDVRRQIKDKSVCFVTQRELLGTGNALLEAKRVLRNMGDNTIFVLNGDSPLTTSKTLKGFLKKHKNDNNDLSLLSFIDESLSGYGRILRDKRGNVMGIVEDRHARTDKERRVKELNSGVYALKSDIMGYLSKLKKHNLTGEYYLTDIVGIAYNNRKKVEAYCCSAEEVMGINTRAELQRALEILNRRNISRLMERGVTFIDPSTSFVHPSVTIGKDTIIYPNTYLEGKTSIAKNCIIYPGVRICNSILGEGVSIKDNTLIEESEVGSGSIIGPFAHLRPHSSIGRNVKSGNFVEIKKSSIGDSTKASHLSYLGDASIGKSVNIGAGTITCNYDGMRKHITIIGSGCFVGSDSQLIAPVSIGRGAYIAAGATVTRDVPAGALAMSRSRQKNIKDWAAKRQLKVKSGKLTVKTKKK